MAPLESQERAAHALPPAGRLRSHQQPQSDIFQISFNIWSTSHNLSQQNMQIPGLTGAKQNSNVPWLGLPSRRNVKRYLVL